MTAKKTSRSEFDLIETYFEQYRVLRRDVVVGIGDDAAVVKIPAKNELVMSMDSLVCGTHFYPDADPVALGGKALVVNLSDLAAMGADPAWMTLALTLPEDNPDWLAGFSSGLAEAAEHYNVQLIGGDTTRGPLAITIQVHGFIPEGKAITRGGAWPGDEIYVTGHLGDSRAGLAILQNLLHCREAHGEYLLKRHLSPVPRLRVGLALRGIATAAIDLSDGLASDLQHILNHSGCRAQVDLDQLPLSDALRESVDEDRWYNYALEGGEDYELLFTIPEESRGYAQTALSQVGIQTTRIGRVITGEPGIEYFKHGEKQNLSLRGWDHFA